MVLDNNAAESWYIIVDPDGSSGYWYRTIARMDPSAKTVVVWSSDESKTRLMPMIPHGIKSGVEFFFNETTIDEIERMGRVKAVLPCCDSSIWLVERLQRGLTPLLSSREETSAGRYDKMAVYDHLHQHGLMEQTRLLMPGDDISGLEISEEMVIKPIDGRGGRNVAFIKNPDDLGRYLSSSSENNRYMLQKRSMGMEYAVDMFTIGGVHTMTALWRYDKPTSTHVKDEVTLVDPMRNRELVATISRYVRKVLSVLDMGFGPSHTEVIVGKEGSISLVEVNFRLHGHLDDLAIPRVLGRNQISMTIEAAMNVFEPMEDETYVFYRPLKKVYFNNVVPKYIESIDWNPIEERIKPNFHATYKHAHLYPGFAGSTTWVGDSLGVVVMIGYDMSRWASDVVVAREFKERMVTADSVEGLRPLEITDP